MRIKLLVILFFILKFIAVGFIQPEYKLYRLETWINNHPLTHKNLELISKYGFTIAAVNIATKPPLVMIDPTVLKEVPFRHLQANTAHEYYHTVETSGLDGILAEARVDYLSTNLLGCPHIMESMGYMFAYMHRTNKFYNSDDSENFIFRINYVKTRCDYKEKNN